MKDYQLLNNPEAIKALGHPLRMKIIDLLTQKKASVGQISQELDLAHAKAFYHVKELKKLGLIELVDTRMIQGIQEKYYQAVAQTFFLGQSLGQGPSESIDNASQAVQGSLREWRRRQILNVDLENLAQKVITDVLALKPGEKVLFSGEAEVMDFCHAMTVSCRKAGGEGMVHNIDLETFATMISETPLEILKETPPLTEALYRELDYWVVFVPLIPEDYLKEVSLEKIETLKKVDAQLHYKYCTDLKTVFVAYPLPQLSHRYLVDYQVLYDAFWKGMNVSRQRIKNEAKNIEEILKTGKTYSIWNELGTHLQFKLKADSQPALDSELFQDKKNGGEITLPEGVIFSFLDEETVSGQIVVPRKEFRGKLIYNLKIFIESGHVTAIEDSSSCPEGLLQYLKEMPDLKKVTALGIGVNPEIQGDELPENLLLRSPGQFQVILGDNSRLGGTARASTWLSMPIGRVEIEQTDGSFA
ncbi:aminopeptidase [Natranaerobius thermophilus]|uniref:Transcriptional regulator, ArsR family n=1 Tax=Natranaerobius thermophilus (strain ATCC BAA-1301 / DSM 18059 / JW/NM-WN-LF) TaxID=457570 RepID=B2A5Z3_NATTJ|nr:aminopeptidase [Natranaerobius thermophilus]ACB85410.1 transcriptional regulator, ArsR family [Natranaerobius thermophilus JW/NM-WN-LF]